MTVKLSTQIFLATSLMTGLVEQCIAQQQDFFNTIDVGSEADRTERRYSLIGWATQKMSYGLEDPGSIFSRQDDELSKFETSIFTQLDARVSENTSFRISAKSYHDQIYRLQAHTDYSADERNEFQNRFEIRDFYLEHQFENDVYLKVGNQIIAWGLSDYLRVTDLINTEDQYTFGQQDLEDLRLQVPAVLASYNIGTWLLEGVVTHEAGRDDIAPNGDEFDQLIFARSLGAALDRVGPVRDQEYFLRASHRMRGGDLQIVAAEFNENSLSVNQVTGTQSVDQQIVFSQNRMRALGIAANKVNGPWLYFGEIGIHKDKAVRPSNDYFLRQPGGWDQKDQLLGVLGIEYNGFRDLLLTLEFNQIRTRDHDQFMEAGKEQNSFGFRFYWTAMNERIQVLGVWNELADDNGEIGRLSLEYNVSDNLDIGILWVDYSSKEDSIFYEYRNNDTLQFQLRYNFQI